MSERWGPQELRELPVTWGLVALHFVLYLYVSAVDPSFSSDVLKRLGGQYNPSIWNGEYHRLLISGLLHGGLFHFLLNNLALLSLGRLLERLLGSPGFGLVYVLSLFGGNIASLLWMPPQAVSVGASGAIMGLAGTLFVLLLLDRKGRFLVASNFGRYFFFGLVLLQFLIGEAFPFINNAAHIGGFVVGFLFAFYFWSRIPGERLPRQLGTWILGGCIAGMGVLLLLGLNPKQTYAWHLHLGLKAFQSKDLKKSEEAARLAEKHLRKAQQLKAQKLDAAYYLGELYLQRKAYAKAAPVFAGLVKAHPDRFTFWFHWITALAKSGQSKAAQAQLSRATRRFLRRDARRGWRAFLRFPQQVHRDLIQARLWTASLQERKAILLYQRMLNEKPKDASLHNEYAWLLCTAHHRKYRHPKLALDHAKFAVKAFPNAAYLDTLAEAYFLNGLYKEAVDTARRAMHSQGALWTMPHLHVQLRRFRAALNKNAPKKPKAATKQPTSPKAALKKVAPRNAASKGATPQKASKKAAPRRAAPQKAAPKRATPRITPTPKKYPQEKLPSRR